MKGLLPLFLGIFGTFAFSWTGSDGHSESANRSSRSADRRRTEQIFIRAAIGHGGARSRSLRRERLRLLPHATGARRLRAAPISSGNGATPQRTARLHFRTPGIPRKNANGTGPREHRRARTRKQESPAAGAAASPAASPGSSATSPAPAASLPVRLQRPADRPRLHLRRVRPRLRLHQMQRRRRTTHRCCFAVIFANGERLSGRKQPHSTDGPNSGRPVADPDRGLAADVFCRLASCASLFAAQHQFRFEHAGVPIPLRETTHCWRAFRGCITTFQCGCATRRLGGCSHVRCKMSGCLFDGAKSIPSVERNQISRRHTGSWRITCDTSSGCFTQSSSSCVARRSQKITQ